MITYDKMKKAADVMRDVSAVLFTPMVCVMAVASAFVMVYGPWTQATEVERLHYMGVGHVVLVFLIALGVTFSQRRDLPTFNVHTPMGDLSMNANSVSVSPPVAPTVTTVTTVNPAPPVPVAAVPAVPAPPQNPEPAHDLP